MNETTATILNAFLGELPPSKKEALLSLLPADEKSLLKALPPTYLNPIHDYIEESDFLSTIHYSWLLPLLSPLPRSELLLFLSILTSAQREPLVRELSLRPTYLDLTPLAARFLQTTLYKNIVKTEDILPLTCLPENSLNALFQLSYDQKSTLIDLLGIYDLAANLRTLIDKKKIEAILRLLTPQERQLLESLIKEKEIIKFPSMHLNKWNNDPKQLRSLLRQRGLNRLAKATTPSHPSFTWHLLHQLDTATAELYTQLAVAVENPRFSEKLQEQLLFLLSRSV